MRPSSPVLPTQPQAPEVIFAKDQPQYRQMPAVVLKYNDGTTAVITHYPLSVKERLKLLFTGSIWLELFTFGQPVQPQRLTMTEPRLYVGNE